MCLVECDFGGAWERMVGEIKSLLPMAESYKEHVLRSILTEIEFLTNNRPLTHLTLEQEDDEPLTPAHFLLGCSGEAEPNISDITKTELVRSDWKRAQAITQQYWRRWIAEYLPKLSIREKWTQPAKPLQIGDIVTFPDEQRKGKWFKGRICELVTGVDGQTRSARIKVGNNVVNRPTVKLAVLEVKRDQTFPNWGKRKETNLNVIKAKAEELASQIPKRKKLKIRPVSWSSSLK